MCGNMCQDVPHFFLGFLSKNSVSASHYKIWSLLTNIWCFRVNIPHRTAAWITKFFQQKVIAAPIESIFFNQLFRAALHLVSFDESEKMLTSTKFVHNCVSQTNSNRVSHIQAKSNIIEKNWTIRFQQSKKMKTQPIYVKLN